MSRVDCGDGFFPVDLLSKEVPSVFFMHSHFLVLCFFFFNLCSFYFPLPAGFSVSGITPRQITFNLPSSYSRSPVIYEVFKVTPDGRRLIVGGYPSSTNPTQQTFAVEPATSYRFVVRALDLITGQRSSFSSPVNVNVPSGKVTVFLFVCFSSSVRAAFDRNL